MLLLYSILPCRMMCPQNGIKLKAAINVCIRCLLLLIAATCLNSVLWAYIFIYLAHSMIIGIHVRYKHSIQVISGGLSLESKLASPTEW